MEARWTKHRVGYQKEKEQYSIDQVTKLVRAIRPDLVNDLHLIKTILES